MTQTPPAADTTLCKLQSLLFPELTDRPVHLAADAPQVSSDGGALLLAQLDQRQGFVERFVRCFSDHRDPLRLEHPLTELLRQRLYSLALGYTDCNDQDRLRLDPLLGAACGQPAGEGPLAGKSTFNRLELTLPEASAQTRYCKIVADFAALEDYFIAEYVRQLSGETSAVTLDLDATDDPLHGHQEGRFFHGYYGHYCYLPLYIFDGDWPVVAWLRTSNRDAADGALGKVQKIVAALRARFPQVRIRLRGDSGFCRDELMSWCECNGVKYLFGLARNARLERERRVVLGLEKARQQSEANGGEPARVFVEFAYGAQSWPAPRWVVAKCEWTSGSANPRYIITNEPERVGDGQVLYEEDYCGRSQMENYIKQQQLDLGADVTSSHTMRANQLRLWLATLAYVFMNQLRRVGLVGTELARATCGTIRTRLLKVGAVVKVSMRRVAVSLSEAFPLVRLYWQAAQRLLALPAWSG